MRHATWGTAAILMLSCAQGAPGGDGIATAAGATTLPPSAPDAGPPAGPCDPSVAATVAVADNGACPGILPRGSACAAEITICSGRSAGADGAGGDTASGATADGRGSVVLSCHRADVGPPQLNYLFVPIAAGFLSKAGLGVDVRPLRDGFIVSQGSYLLPPPGYDFLAHDGTLRAAEKGGALYADPNGAIVVRAEGGQLTAQAFDADGTLRGTAAFASFAGAVASLTFDGARNAAGNTLVIWQAYGESAANARWLLADGTPSSAAFSLGGWTERAPQAAALAGGAVAIAAQPESGNPARKWRGVIGPGETVERPAPGWLASRGDFFLLPSDKGMAFGNEILAADGTACGSVDLGAPLVGIGVDGTAFSAPSEKTFRIHPQLFR